MKSNKPSVPLPTGTAAVQLLVSVRCCTWSCPGPHSPNHQCPGNAHGHGPCHGRGASTVVWAAPCSMLAARSSRVGFRFGPCSASATVGLRVARWGTLNVTSRHTAFDKTSQAEGQQNTPHADSALPVSHTYSAVCSSSEHHRCLGTVTLVGTMAPLYL